MKSKFLFFLLCCWLLPASFVQAKENKCVLLTATGNVEYSPFLWREGGVEKKVEGANKLIIEEVARRLGITIILKDVGSWARAQEMLKRGDIDLMAGVFYTDPRAQYMDYIDPPFFGTNSVVWSQSGRLKVYRSENDLIGLRGVTVINNSFGQEFDQFAEKQLDLIYVPSLEQAFAMLKRGRADYLLYEKNPGLAYAELYGYTDLFEILEPAVSGEGLYLSVSKKSNCNTEKLRERLSLALMEMKESGFMDQALLQGFKRWRIFVQ